MKAMKTMKAMKAMKAMTKGALADAVASECELKKGQVVKVLDAIAGVAAAEVKKTGIFTIPGVARILGLFKEVFHLLFVPQTS
jgi:hypothetical protein